MLSLSSSSLSSSWIRLIPSYVQGPWSKRNIVNYSQFTLLKNDDDNNNLLLSSNEFFHTRRRLRRCRQLSSSSDKEKEKKEKEDIDDMKRTAARNYLEAWVGGGSSNSSRQTTLSNPPPPLSSLSRNTNSLFNKEKNHQPLLVTGASYLLPTIRLERSDVTANAKEIEQWIQNSLGSDTHSNSSSLSSFSSSPAVRSLLRRFSSSLDTNNTTTTHNHIVPAVLDIGALAPDGSPHYKRPRHGYIADVIYALKSTCQIHIVGITGVSWNDSVLSIQWIQLGLPWLMMSSSSSSSSSLRKSSSSSDSMSLYDLVHLLRMPPANTNDNNEDKEGEIHMKEQDDNNDENHANIITGHQTHDQEDNDFAIKEESSFLKKEKNDILVMDFRELQRQCKYYGLPAIGTKDILCHRLLDYIQQQQQQQLLSTVTAATKHDDDDDTDIITHSNSTTTSTTTNNDNISSQNKDDIQTISNKDNNNNNDQHHHHQTTFFTGAHVYRGSVRSGQQISSIKPGQSLIILGSVNSGGEVMADGDVYIFGRLSGRALAGLGEKENKENERNGARIFASHFDPELVCIGQSFTTIDHVKDVGLGDDNGNDNVDGSGNAAMVSLDENDELVFERVSL